MSVEKFEVESICSSTPSFEDGKVPKSPSGRYDLVENHLKTLFKETKVQYAQNIFGHFKDKKLEEQFFLYTYGKHCSLLRFYLLLCVFIHFMFFLEGIFTNNVNFQIGSYLFYVIVSVNAFVLWVVFMIWFSYFFKFIKRSCRLCEVNAILIISLISALSTCQTVIVEGEGFPVFLILILFCNSNLSKLRVFPGQSFVSVVIVLTYVVTSIAFFRLGIFRLKNLAFLLSILISLIFVSIQQFIVSKYFRLLFKKSKELKTTIKAAERENIRKLEILKNILPLQYVEKFKRNHFPFVQVFEDMNVVITDLTDFTSYASRVTTKEVISVLNLQYSKFDDIVNKYGFEKVKSIGDSHFSISGMQMENTEEKSVSMSLSLIIKLQELNEKYNWSFSMRVGVGKGLCYLSVLGSTQLNFDCFGEGVFEAKKMESLGKSDTVHVSEKIYEATKDKFEFILNTETCNSYFLKKIKENILRVEKIPNILNSSLSAEFKKYQSGSFKNLEQFECFSDTSSNASTVSTASSLISIDEPTRNNTGYFSLKNLMRFKKIKKIYKGQDKILKYNYILNTAIFLVVVVIFNLLDIERNFVKVTLIIYYILTFCSFLITVGYYIFPKYYLIGLFSAVCELIFSIIFLFLYILFSFETRSSSEKTSNLKLNILMVIWMTFLQFNLIIIPFIIKLLIVFLSLSVFFLLDTVFFGFKYDILIYYIVIIFIQIFSFYVIEYAFFKHFFIHNKINRKLVLLKNDAKKNENILKSSLPSCVIERIQSGKNDIHIFDSIKDGSVCFIDISGLDDFLMKNFPIKVISLLNELFSFFDHTVNDSGCYKIKSIGTTYLFVSGIGKKVIKSSNHELKILNCARTILEKVAFIIHPYNKKFGCDEEEIGIKIGINSGQFHAGIVGESKFLYDVFGDSINTCARMCFLSEINKIQICSLKLCSIFQESGYFVQKRGNIDVKGKGNVDTFYVFDKTGFDKKMSREFRKKATH